MSGGRSTVLSPSSSECHAPHSQASIVTPSKPSTAATSSDWKDSRRNSPSVTTGQPGLLLQPDRRRGRRGPRCALNAARSSSPAAYARRASRSSGGRRRLPTWSAWAVTIPVTLVAQQGGALPHDRVGVVRERGAEACGSATPGRRPARASVGRVRPDWPDEVSPRRDMRCCRHPGDPRVTDQHAISRSDRGLTRQGDRRRPRRRPAPWRPTRTRAPGPGRRHGAAPR